MAALCSFYRWQKHKSLLFRRHVTTECLFWHVHSPCSLSLCISAFFWELAPLYFPSTELTKSCFKSQRVCKSEPQSTQCWTRTQLPTTRSKAGWSTSPGCTDAPDSLRGRIQLYHLITLTRQLFALLSLTPGFMVHTHTHLFNPQPSKTSHLITTRAQGGPLQLQMRQTPRK